MKCLAFLLLAFVSFAAAGRPSNFFAGDLKPAASEYARAAGLAPLRSTTGFELRVWTRDYMSGRVAGFIVSNGKQRSFASESTHHQGTLVVKTAGLEVEKPVFDLAGLKKLIEVLKAYNGKAASCGVMDGESDLVDAVVQGQVVTVEVDNPRLCSDKASRTVAAVLDALRH
ncbi:hypothetical protein [Luteibacter sp. dw_328]|uniref:hypothetical protein n=1 Tax=Luteibacter sp. dw_328 TaxID=2719796 RepID=UPI001BD2E2C0|nr:hypothetical protein [Luteibacter sp. dw_328]